MKKIVIILAACCISSTLLVHTARKEADMGSIATGKTGILQVPQLSRGLEFAQKFSFNPKAIGKKAELFIRTRPLTFEIAKNELHLDSFDPSKGQILFEVLAQVPGQTEPKQVFNTVLSERDIGKPFAYAIDSLGKAGIGFKTSDKATGQDAEVRYKFDIFK